MYPSDQEVIQVAFEHHGRDRTYILKPTKTGLFIEVLNTQGVLLAEYWKDSENSEFMAHPYEQ